MSDHSLTQEQIVLGQLYAWIHSRAEYLRSQQAKNEAETGTGSEAHPISADSQAIQPKQTDSITTAGQLQMEGK